MDMNIIINIAYVISAAMFIFGLKLLGSPATARNGNLLSSMGMMILRAGSSSQEETTFVLLLSPFGGG